MRIVLLTQILPLPLDAGPKTRAYYVLRYLAEFGHEVTLVARADRFGRGGDHTAFNQHGFAGVRVTEANEAYQRQPPNFSSNS